VRAGNGGGKPAGQPTGRPTGKAGPSKPAASTPKPLEDFPGCFTATTPVATQDGLRSIERVRPLDKVWAFNLATREWQLCYVQAKFERAYVGEIVTVGVNDEVIEATAHHPFWVVRGEALGARPTAEHIPEVPAGSRVTGRWVDAIDLRVGDVLLLRNGRECPVQKLQVREAALPVYNFRVENLACYAVGHSQVLVHNNSAAKPPKVTRKIPRDKLKYAPPERGKAPIGQDGKPVELHHEDPSKGNKSGRVEMTQQDHRGKGNFSKNHENTGQRPSAVDRVESRAQHRRWWEIQWDKGEFKNLPPPPK
jgi:hypothetical protein